jgi:endo-1,4-beta-xylanase
MEKERRTLRPNEKSVYTKELEQLQAAKYKEVFKVFRDYKNIVTGVTFWNLSDQYSWLDDYPVKGRKIILCFLISIVNPRSHLLRLPTSRM